MPDPDVFYSIVDVNGLNEITLYTGDSITLYIDQNSLNSDVLSFDLEATISDPNLGWIDNDPAGSAAILSWGNILDFIQPGYTQSEGIRFYAVKFGNIQDGAIAAFNYTATDVGDVTLDLINYDMSNAGLEPILIHQVVSPAETVQMLEEFRASGEFNVSVTESEWNALMASVEETQSNDPNSVSQ
jgi:hypothetical protein